MPNPIPGYLWDFQLLEAQAAGDGGERLFATETGDLTTRIDQLRHRLSAQEAELVALRRRLYLDPVTAAANPRALYDAWEGLDVELPAGLVVVDIDGFHRVNARGGRRVGDAVLRAVVVHMQRVLRRDDVLARTGGDEFTVLLPATRRSDTINVAYRLRAAIQQLCFRHEGLRLRLSLTIGVAFRSGPEPLVCLIERTDEAMLRAKHWGGGRIALS